MPSEISEWAMEVNSYSQLPGFFKNLFSEGIGDKFPFTVYAPAAMRKEEKTNSKLISLRDDSVLYLE